MDNSHQAHTGQHWTQRRKTNVIKWQIHKTYLLVDGGHKWRSDTHSNDHTSVEILMQHHRLNEGDDKKEKRVHVSTPDHLRAVVNKCNQQPKMQLTLSVCGDHAPILIWQNNPLPPPTMASRLQGWTSTSFTEFCWLSQWRVTAWEIMISKMADVVVRTLWENNNKFSYQG